jgi:hypothetical protein
MRWAESQSSSTIALEVGDTSPSHFAQVFSADGNV